MIDFKAVLFDMDGVLLDTESVCSITWKKAAEEFGIENIEEAFEKAVGRNRKDVEMLLKEYLGDKVTPVKFRDRTSELFYEIERSDGLSLMPDVVECLQFLKSKGLRLAVASSTRGENVRRQLKNAGIIHFFETLTTGDMVEHSKPAPDIYLLSAGSLGLKPSECIAIEDSPNGVLAASAAGIRCIMVPDYIKPDENMKKTAWKICDSLNDIKALLE